MKTARTEGFLDMYRGGLIRHPRGLAGHRTEAVAQEPQSLGRWEPNLGHSGEGHQVGSQRLLPAAANGGWVRQDAAECEDGDASQMWSWKVPGASDLSHGSAQDSAAGCWASGGGLSQLHTGLIKGYEQNRFPHILCSFARLRDPITFQVLHYWLSSHPRAPICHPHCLGAALYPGPGWSLRVWVPLSSGEETQVRRDIPFAIIYFPLFANLNHLGFDELTGKASSAHSFAPGCVAGSVAAVTVTPLEGNSGFRRDHLPSRKEQAAGPLS
ncbi:mitochondrial glutamate carrier 2 [Equus przewalskii]|uniref:Mitochondrial glutamate carrier 2 n=1 Tax=Equus przewalskii TaxID=9798 RepID=A0ABM4PGY1_EQUPR